MNIDLLEITTTALREVADTHSDGHLVDDRSPFAPAEALTTAAGHVDRALDELHGALAALLPVLPMSLRPCACRACKETARTVAEALDALCRAR